MKNTSIADDTDVTLWTRGGLQCVLLSNAVGVQIEVRTLAGAPLCGEPCVDHYDAVRRSEKLLVLLTRQRT